MFSMFTNCARNGGWIRRADSHGLLRWINTGFTRKDSVEKTLDSLAHGSKVSRTHSSLLRGCSMIVCLRVQASIESGVDAGWVRMLRDDGTMDWVSVEDALV